jgi:trimethylamine--corrinoid protein Co-methyltransferase
MTDISKVLRVPMFSTAGCSDSKTLDQQAAIEAALSIAIAGLSGASLIHDVGFLESALIGSYEMVVMSNEIIGLVKRILRGIPVDAKHLALDAIARVGPGGHYLMDEHTLENFRSEFWRPELLDRANWEVWQADGARTMRTRVHDKVLELVDQYEPAPIPDEIEDRLLAIIQQADDAHRAEELVTLA